MQALAEAKLLEVQVLAAKLELVGERRQLAVVAHQHAKQVGHVLQRVFGALRLLAHERKHGVDAVEQEVRADAGLQAPAAVLRRSRAKARARAGGSRRAGRAAAAEPHTSQAMSTPPPGSGSILRRVCDSDDARRGSVTSTTMQAPVS